MQQSSLQVVAHDTPAHRPVSGLVLALGLLAASLLLGPGCSTGARLNGQAQALEELTDDIHDRARRCAPEQLAIAEASVEFGKYELTRGDFVRARRHLNLAEENAKLADKLSNFEECKPQQVVVAAEVEPTPEIQEVEPTPTDKDGDGLLDEVDKCPEVPEDFDKYQDDDGCPEEDNDADGIADRSDACPDIAEDLDQYQDGDGCPEFDNDLDGYADKQDSCALQPEDFDGFQDDDGCPDSDNDKDKIADVLDQCPLEPEDYDGDQDEDGCKDALAKVVGDRIELGQKVYFKYDKSEVLPRSFPLLNEVAQILKDNPGIQIRVEGHTDSRGSDRYNKKLSQERAASVVNYLQNQGVSGARMAAQGLGEERPIEDNNTEAGRAANRRVEIHITAR